MGNRESGFGNGESAIVRYPISKYSNPQWVYDPIVGQKPGFLKKPGFVRLANDLGLLYEMLPLGMGIWEWVIGNKYPCKIN